MAERSKTLRSGRSLLRWAWGLGSNPGEEMDVCKCIVPSQHAIEPQVPSGGWWKGKRGERLLTTPGILPQNWGGNEPNHTITCMVLKATANDRRHLALCHHEFRGSRYGLYRSGGISNNNNNRTEKYATRNHDYWKKRRVPYVKPMPLFGSVLENTKRPLYQIFTERYYKLGPVYGFFEANKPFLSVGDPALLKNILVKDFPAFSSRRVGELFLK
ncbi:cytochrome P450 3A11 [Trichonephila clavipes]|nr:cytochrome P450 3A11 [Trichonephila clavipes]